MKRSIRVSILVASMCTTLLAGKNDLPNGDPFQQLDEMIKANETRIEENRNLIDLNSNAIHENASSIQTLRVKIDEVSDDLAVIEKKVEQNSEKIMKAVENVESTKADVAQNSQALFDLALLLDSNVELLNSDITLLKQETAGLSDSLLELRTNITEAIVNLDDAITINSGDIEVLSALVSSTNAKLSLANSEILSFQERINTLEATQTNQDELLVQIQENYISLNDKLQSIETASVGVSSVKELSLDGTAGNDYNFLELKQLLMGLDYKSNEYFYFKGENSMRGTREFCSNDSRISYILMLYTINQTSYINSIPQEDTTWIKNSANEEEWVEATSIYIRSNTSDYNNQDFDLQAGSSGTFARITLQDRRPYSVCSSYIGCRSYDYSNYDIVFQGYPDVKAPNSLIIRTGSDREAVCGF